MSKMIKKAPQVCKIVIAPRMIYKPVVKITVYNNINFMGHLLDKYVTQ